MAVYPSLRLQNPGCTCTADGAHCCLQDEWIGVRCWGCGGCGAWGVGTGLGTRLWRRGRGDCELEPLGELGSLGFSIGWKEVRSRLSHS